MLYLIMLFLIIIICIVAGKAFNNMPNPGKRFYYRINKEDKDEEN